MEFKQLSEYPGTTGTGIDVFQVKDRVEWIIDTYLQNVPLEVFFGAWIQNFYFLVRSRSQKTYIKFDEISASDWASVYQAQVSYVATSSGHFRKDWNGDMEQWLMDATSFLAARWE